MTHVQTGTSALDADCCLLHQHTVGIEDVDGGDAVFVALHQYLLVGVDHAQPIGRGYQRCLNAVDNRLLHRRHVG